MILALLYIQIALPAVPFSFLFFLAFSLLQKDFKKMTEYINEISTTIAVFFRTIVSRTDLGVNLWILERL